MMIMYLINEQERRHPGEVRSKLPYHQTSLFHSLSSGVDPNKRYLFLRVNGGCAFLDHLQHAHTICSSTLTLHVGFRGQRVCVCVMCVCVGVCVCVCACVRVGVGVGV